MKLQTIERLPKVSLEKWAKCVENILQNKQYYFDAMIQLLSYELDNSLVAVRCVRFILRQKDATC